ncbi:hypothetical protein EVAR_67997_1 [Eumeta japonica]|uniref:Uncharacterized protein n=1 Tax=Eumeta variegata TaxID=151549 RepID=A0A4C2AES4_EUMVA|nr:hypothetical protein EVAR_67997_1 [Eumeta japonica]
MASSRRVCVNDPNHFCFICGEYIFKESRLNVTAFVIKVYKNYFGYPLGIKNKPWIPQKNLKPQEEAMDIEEKIESSDSDFEYDLKAPELFNQTDLNDLIRNKETRISYYRTRERNLLKFC